MHLVTHDDLLGIRAAGAPALSPDGSAVAFTISDSWATGRRPRSQIWLAPLAGGAPRPLTGGPQSDREPRWSPDGGRLAFLSDRGAGGEMRVHLLTPATGRIEPVVCPAGDVVDFQWSADGSALAVLLRPTSPAPAKDPICFEAEPRPSRVWVVPLGGGEARAVTPPDLHVWEFDWSPDGARFALISSATPYEWSWYQTRLTLAGPGGLTMLHDPGRRQLARPLWSPDGATIAFLSAALSDRGSVGADLWTVPAAGGEARDLTAGYGGSVTWMEWRSATELLLLAYEGFETVLATLQPGAAPRVLNRGEFAAGPRFQPCFSRAGALLALSREDCQRPADIWTFSAAAGWQQLTDLNPQVREWAVPATEVVRWRSFDDQVIEGMLTLPPDGRAPYPLIVSPHGGPTSCTHRRFVQGWNQLLAARGYAVLQPNFRGSTGRGLAFSEANLGDLGGGDWRDIEAGVDALVASGVADPERLGFGGWSYGGFLTAWAVTRTRRYRAAVMGAGIANWLSFHGRSYLQTWDQIYLQGDPYTSDNYRRWSPIHHVDNVKTPVLIVHGEKDGDVPVGQSYEFHRALAERGVPAELVVYPREPHGLREPAHLRDLWTRIEGFYAGHLGV